jgi:hypothetical protein
MVEDIESEPQLGLDVDAERLRSQPFIVLRILIYSIEPFQ